MVFMIPAYFSSGILFSSLTPLFDAMCIIIAEQTSIVPIMQCQRVADPVWNLRCRLNFFSAELNPIAIFKWINYVIQIQQGL